MNYDETMRANLDRVFNQRDPDQRIAAIRELYAEGAVLYEPDAVVNGHAAIDRAVSTLLNTLPAGFGFTAIGEGIGHHDMARLRWQLGPPDGSPSITGTDVAVFENGLIKSLHVFLDAPIG